MTKFLKFNILLLILLQTRFFCFLPFDAYDVAKGISIGIVILFIVCVMIIPKCITDNRGYFAIDICIFIFICLLQCILTELKYRQGYLYVFAISIYYFTMLLYLLLIYFVKNDYEKVKNYFKIISLIFSNILIIQWFLYNNFRITFLELNLDIGQRFGEARINTGVSIISIGVILSVSSIIKCVNNRTKLKKVDILTVILGLVDVVFVSKTRSAIIMLIVSIIVMNILLLRNNNHRIIFIVSLLITSILVFNTDIFDKFINLGSTEYAGNSNIRTEASMYFIQKIKETPIVGIGFLHSKNEYDPAYYFLRGPEGKYFLDDVGLIGFSTTFGLIGLIWYLNVIFKCFNIIITKFKNKKVYDNGECIGLFVFILLSTFTVIFTDAIRIFYLPFILYFIEENKLNNVKI